MYRHSSAHLRICTSVNQSVCLSALDTCFNRLRPSSPRVYQASRMASSKGSGNEGAGRAWYQRLPFTNRSGSADNDDSDKGNSHNKRTRAAINEKAQSSWKEEKSRYLSQSEEEKRRVYKCKNWHVLEDVLTWPMYYKRNEMKLLKQYQKGKYTADFRPKVNEKLNSKVSIWKGDITSLEIDCIVNAANSSLLGGGGVDGAIHNAAGKLLVQECRTLKGCDTGNSKITGGYRLPAKYVIHTVGPIRSGDNDLISCYETSYKLMQENKLRSIAFPCISTGIYGFPNDRAAHIALHTTREFLEANEDKVDRVIFCLFLPKDVEIYDCLMQEYFPMVEKPPTDEESGTLEKEKEPSEDPSLSKESKQTENNEKLSPNGESSGGSTAVSKDASNLVEAQQSPHAVDKDGVNGENSPAKSPAKGQEKTEAEETSKEDQSPNAKKEKKSDSPETSTASRM